MVAKGIDPFSQDAGKPERYWLKPAITSFYPGQVQRSVDECLARLKEGGLHSARPILGPPFSLRLASSRPRFREVIPVNDYFCVCTKRNYTCT